MTTTKNRANQFILHGDNTTISFATTSFSGKPTFAYKSGETQLNLTGSDIRSVDAEFAKLVTVSIDDGSDAGDSLVTLLVPTLSLLAIGETAQFDTVAIVTSVRKFGPVHQRYRVIKLHGSATFVEF
jgi:hypothetical protein